MTCVSVVLRLGTFVEVLGMPRKPDSAKIGIAVRRLRTEAGLTQAELAAHAETADETISRIERNRLVPSIDLAARLAAALRVSPNELLASSKTTPAGKVRACDRRFLALVRDLDETQVDDLARGLKLILAVGRQARRRA